MKTSIICKKGKWILTIVEASGHVVYRSNNLPTEKAAKALRDNYLQSYAS